MRKGILGFIGIFALLGMIVLTSCKSFRTIDLDMPQNIKYDSTTITWDEVKDAERYTISINGGNEYTVTIPSYPYTAQGVSEFTVSIVASSTKENVNASAPAVASFKELETIEEIRFNEAGVASWDAVENATAYLVRIDEEEVETPVTTNSFSEIPVGEHTIQVRPIVTDNASYYSRWSEGMTVTILDTIDTEDIKYENGFITWKYVSEAVAYEIRVNGTVLTSECTATTYAFEAENKDFDVTIKALGDKETVFNGAESDIKSFVFLETVSNINIEDGIVRWDAVEKADGYRIKINGNVLDEILTENYYDGLKAGVSTDIQILPICNDTSYFSDWSAMKSVYILESPVIKWNSEYALDGEANNNVYWDGIAGATGYEVRLTLPDGTKEIISFGETQRNFAEAYLEVGTYVVELKALASATSSEVYDSKFSTPINITRLPAPKAAPENFITSNASKVSDGFTVTFTGVAGASGYVLKRDNIEITNSVDSQFTVRDVVNSDVNSEQTYNFSVSSKGSVTTVDGVVNVRLTSLSAEALSFSIKVLATPATPDISGYVYRYGAISGNNGYAIDVQGQTYTSGTTEYDLSNIETGVYDVRVCARGNGSDILASNYSQPIQVNRLAAPTNIRIDTSEASEGVLTYNTVNYATGYYVVFNNDGQAVPVETISNMNQYVTEEGTSVYMVSTANYFNDTKTIYYMTSKPSQTANFIKLEAPEFGDVAFSNTQLIWNIPGNIIGSEYTPTYEVYYANGTTYNGEKNGTTMDISYLEGGKEYTFYVKAIGNGTNYINSEKSVAVTIYKLATPEVTRDGGKYVWKGVTGATTYAVYVENELKETFTHEALKTYEFTPYFDELKTYKVEVYAIGDGGYTTINSQACLIEQETKQLQTPNFNFSYSHDSYNAAGTIDVEITEQSPYANGYSYTVGGVTKVSKELTYSHMPSSVGTYEVRVYAVGGNFDEEGIYYLDSQSRGGSSSYSVTLLATPNQNSMNLSADGKLSWATINSAVGYELEISVDGQAYGEVITVRNLSSYVLTDFEQYIGHSIKVRIRAIGNNTNIISSETVEREWNL